MEIEPCHCHEVRRRVPENDSSDDEGDVFITAPWAGTAGEQSKILNYTQGVPISMTIRIFNPTKVALDFKVIKVYTEPADVLILNS